MRILSEQDLTDSRLQPIRHIGGSNESERPIGWDEVSFVDLRALFGPIKRRIRLIAVTFLAIVVLAAVVLFSLTPLYSSMTLVYVDPSSKNLLVPDAQMNTPVADNARIDSEVEILKSDAVIAKVVNDEALYEDSEFGAGAGWRRRITELLRLDEADVMSREEQIQAAMEKLRRRLAIARRGATSLISIEMTSMEPQKAARLANAIAQTYIREQLDSKIGGTLAMRNVLAERIERASQAVQETEERFESFITDYLENSDPAALPAAVSVLRQSLEAARAERARLFDAINRASVALEKKNWTAVAEDLGSQTLRQLASKYVETREEVTTASAQRAATLRSELERIEGELNTQAVRGLASLRNTITGSETRISEVQQQIRAAVAVGDLPMASVAKLYQLQQDADVARSQYQTLLSRLREVEAQADLQVADSRVVSAALPSLKPSFPKTLTLMFLASGAGLALGIGLAFLYENVVGGFVSEAQTSNLLRISNVMSVPRLHETSIADPTRQSSFTEYMKKMVLVLDNAQGRLHSFDNSDNDPALVTVICSAAPGEGKSTLALALAQASAASGARTLLIDCDLRRPTLNKLTGINPDVALQDVLGVPSDQQVSLKGLFHRDAKTGLDIIYGARRPSQTSKHPTVIKILSTFISAVSKRYDRVIVDTPAILPVVDGLYLARSADLLIFVVKWAATSQMEVKSALASLREAVGTGPEIACVLNQKDPDMFDNALEYNSYYSDSPVRSL